MLRNRVLSMIMAMMMVIACAMPASAWAETATDSENIAKGNAGENIIWTLDLTTGDMIFEGKGEMEQIDIFYESFPWYQFADKIKTLKLSEGITSISKYAFSGCDNLTEIVIPSSLTTIDRQAFNGCNGLVEIRIPDTVTSIGGYAFGHCENLKKVVLPKGLTSIDDKMFWACTGLKEVVIPTGVVSIEDYAFYWCTDLEEINIPESVASIGDYAFAWCGKLKGLELPKKVTEISDYMCYGCENLKNVDIPQNVIQIGDYAFTGCSNLVGIVLPEKLTSIGELAFSACSSLTEINIPDEVTAINTGSFVGCSGLTKLELPQNVTSIGASAFWNCTGLKEVVIPDGVTSIGYNAFAGCTDLTEIMIPPSVSALHENAFSECNNLKEVILSQNCNMDIHLTGVDIAKLIVPYKVSDISVDKVKELFVYNPEANISNVVLSDDGKIYGYADSTAEDYAIENGYTFVDIETIHVHSYSENEIYKEATCTTAGEEGKSCVCGDKVNAEIPAKGHTYSEWTVETTSTCTEEGVEARICICGEKETRKIEKLAHSYNVVITEPTCERAGYTTYTCECGDTYVADKMPANGHAAGAEATCEAAQICTVCHAELKAATGHAYGNWIVDKAATCTVEGFQHKECACGDKVTETIKALGHDMIVVPAVAATCDESGLTEGTHCSVCDTVIDAQKEVPALGHKAGAAAACETAQSCIVCNAEMTPAAGHKWSDDYIVDKAATIKTAGSKSVHCDTCDVIKNGSSVKIAKIRMTTASTVVYNGKIRNGNVTVVDFGGKQLKKGKDFTVTYKNAKGTKTATPKVVGTYTAVVKFQGDYSGTVTKTFKINPQGTKINKLTKPAKKQIKVTWKKQAVQTTGYQIRYSTKQNMNNAKTVTVAKKGTTTKTIKQLKSKKKYWVQIRTYKTVNGEKYFSAWSGKKTVITK